MKTEIEILIIKELSGNASEKEKNELKNWLSKDPANEEEFNNLKNIWTSSRVLKPKKEHDVDAAWNDFKTLRKDKPVILNKRSVRPMQIAAAIALLVISAFLVKLFLFNDTDQIINVKAESVVIGKESGIEIVTLTVSTGDSAKVFLLPDSSKVYLNKNSKLTYPEKFTGKERASSLSGEGFFEVVHNGKPFIVECKGTRTKVLGTSFNIKGYETDEKLTVSVVTGTVELSNKTNDHLLLTANERGTVNNEEATITKTNYSDKNFIWWKKNGLKTRIKKIINNIKQKIN